MAPSPFEHGLALAWSDGALSRRGAQLLELLQTRLELNDDSRASIEETWQESLVNLSKRSFGDGDETLSSWLEALKETSGLEKAAKDLGRTSLEIGLSRSIWAEAYSFAEGLGLGDAFAAVEVAGPKSRDVLAKGCTIDLHPRAFKTGSVVQTNLAKAQIALYQIDEITYRIFARRSFAEYLWIWLEDAGMEYGVSIETV